MCICHVPLSDICKMEWEEMIFYHERALAFYRVDRQALAALVPWAYTAALTPPEDDYGDRA